MGFPCWIVCKCIRYLRLQAKKAFLQVPNFKKKLWKCNQCRKSCCIPFWKILLDILISFPESVDLHSTKKEKRKKGEFIFFIKRMKGWTGGLKKRKYFSRNLILLWLWPCGGLEGKWVVSVRLCCVGWEWSGHGTPRTDHFSYYLFQYSWSPA